MAVPVDARRPVVRETRAEARPAGRAGRVDPVRNGATLVRLLSLADAAPFAALAERAGRRPPPPPWRQLVRAG
ncbi:hypothetical protein [Aciditerrimonas ferrireducens]|uniref:hypothetical protein n=1 Tax=Aciditerrimonas ferrireducens TaxID=667306 RepID=UPI0020040F30|nr:hypothetical protein [Aciditerrimonas ferrireducens]MCK4176176.1 hypothetical protein [Aciditerrimonas ferrireducens]